MKIKTAIFDLDGTLLNTLGDLTDSVNAAIVPRGYPAASEEDTRQRVGNGIRNLIARSLGDNASDTLTDTCLDEFRIAYEARLMNRTQPYDGILPLLRQLKAAEVSVGVLSNKYDLATKALIRHYFGDLVQQALGERPGVPRKPDPRSALDLMQLLDADPKTTLYIGDSAVDMQTAKRAGLTAIGVTWGYRSAEVLTEAGADLLVHHPADLLPLFQNGLPDYEAVRRAFESRGFRVKFCQTAEDATRYLTTVLTGHKVSFGGSSTLEELHLYDALRGKAELHWHWRAPGTYVQNADVYISSANALSATGEIVNIDGTGNRLAGTLFGAKKVYFVCGINKLCPDLASAGDRARNIAAPLNAKRLHRNTPCAIDGKCHDCRSPERICHAMAVQFAPMNGTECELVLIGTPLGF